MNTDGLEKIYSEKLSDLYDAEKQILVALPKIAKATSSSDLKEAFEKHLEQTKGHVMRLDKIFSQKGERPEGKTCKGMEGLLKEGEELLKEQEQDPALDAGLIAAAQSVEHYEMAGYGSAQTWARQLGREEAANLLEETLEEEKETDAELIEIAETLVNPEAGGTAEEDDEEEEDLEEDEDIEGEEGEEVMEEDENDGDDEDEDIDEDEEEEETENAETQNRDGGKSNAGDRNVGQRGQAPRQSRSSAGPKRKGSAD